MRFGERERISCNILALRKDLIREQHKHTERVGLEVGREGFEMQACPECAMGMLRGLKGVLSHRANRRTPCSMV